MDTPSATTGTRATAGMDIWVATHPTNAQRTVTALREFGFDLPDLSPELFLREWQIIRLGVPPVGIEIATTLSDVHFAECYAERVDDSLAGVPVGLMNLKHLKENKEASCRHQDLADLEHLP